ncbi:MAG: DUF2807 domain-containing protein [bacterium]
MKNIAIILLIFLLQPVLSGQNIRGTGPVTSEEKQVGFFNSIRVGGAQEVILQQGDQHTVIIETNENLHDKISFTIQDGTLRFEYKNIRNYDRMKFYVTAPEFRKIIVSGASDVTNKDTLRGELLFVSVTGASDVELTVNYRSLESKVSGASDLILHGMADQHQASANGASNLIASDLMTKSTEIRASGASSCFVEAASNLTYTLSGASTVKYVNKPETLIIRNKGASKNVVIMRDTIRSGRVYNYDDTTRVNLGAFDVEVIDGDTTRVSVGAHTLIVDEDGNVKYERNKKLKFNGHWGGVELGINGYVTPDFNSDWADKYDFLRLRYEKSWQVNLNIYEQNIPLNKDRNMGLVSGIGMSWNNYRFSSPTFISPDSSQLTGFYMVNENNNFLSVRKTKLTAMYITVPLMYEIQTKNPRKIKRFHFGIGAQMSIRVRSHTKIYFNQGNYPYYLQDPGTKEVLPYEFRTPATSYRNIIKNYNSFHLQPFKFDAMVRVGYGIVNLWAHFGLNTMFKKDEAPLLHSWAAGITLVGW